MAMLPLLQTLEPLLMPLAVVPYYWHLPILIVVISLVYSATRFDEWQPIVRVAVRWGLRPKRSPANRLARGDAWTFQRTGRPRGGTSSSSPCTGSAAYFAFWARSAARLLHLFRASFRFRKRCERCMSRSCGSIPRTR